jgi:hypothetical protein
MPGTFDHGEPGECIGSFRMWLATGATAHLQFAGWCKTLSLIRVSTASCSVPAGLAAGGHPPGLWNCWQHFGSPYPFSKARCAQAAKRGFGKCGISAREAEFDSRGRTFFKLVQGLVSTLRRDTYHSDQMSSRPNWPQKTGLSAAWARGPPHQLIFSAVYKPQVCQDIEFSGAALTGQPVKKGHPMPST